MVDTGFLDILSLIMPFIPTIIIGIVAGGGFWYYRYRWQPELARTITKAYHTKALLAFIQDEMGNIAAYICDKKFPEGVVHIKGKGWFLLPNPPETPVFESEVLELPPGFKKPRGRPPKNPVAIANNIQKKDAYEKAILAADKLLVQTPILRGFGKQVFFGSANAVALSGLGGIAHANIPAVRNLAPKMYQKTQIDALFTGGRMEGIKMSTHDPLKILFYVIIAVVPIAVTGLIVYLLMSKGGA
jgi:hypothetical protein